MATTDSVARIIALSAMGGGGVSEVDYSKATNKPRINGNELVGDKTSTDLGLASIEAISNVVYEPSTGIMTFEKENGTSFNIDLPLELLIKSGSYDATTKEILLELANGDVIRINVGDLVDTYFGDEETIELFQEGGENKFRVKETLLTKIYDELNKRLKYKGHVNSKDDLPTAGQASGEAIEPSLSVSYLNGGNKSTVQKYYAKKQYFLSQFKNGSNYGVLSTDFPEIVDGVCLGFKPWGTTVFVHLNATGTKTAIIDYDSSNQGMVDYDDGSAWNKTKSTTITKSAWVALYRSPGYEGDFSGNFPNPIKFKIPSKDTFVFANGTDSVDVNYKSLTNNNFTYNSGYKLFEFPSDKSFEWVTTTPSDINENDVYTVGANYDLVRGNAVEQKWEPLAPKSIEIDNNTITLSSENKIQARAIIDKNTNNANSFWTGTKAEYDALGVYDENTFYAITDEAASIQSALTEVSGYDAAKTQILKNINGTLTWVDSQ